MGGLGQLSRLSATLVRRATALVKNMLIALFQR